MKKIHFIAYFSFFILLLFACKSQNQSSMPLENKNHQNSNALIHETSPYLLQHAYNPVDWQAWNDVALQQAKEEDKLIIISVGYAACHWCHVMEHESFEDSTVAQWMNEHFVTIKVDREERPDIDQIYMDACQLLNQSGGWPLNAIALPDGRPIFAGTYFPQDQWLKILKYFAEYYPANKEEAIDRATQIAEGIAQNDLAPLTDENANFSVEALDLLWENWQGKIDFSEGGRSGAPKFPMPTNWQYLLRHNYFTQNQNALQASTTTLDKMMMGGIYDQVGGGFARYSVDEVWKVPHFEKMLYDNGQLVTLYAQTYAHTGEKEYANIVQETTQWIERELMSEEGGFYSSLDADSEGEEGKYYVWQAEELDSLLGENSDLLKKYWSVTEHGNWEENNILYKTKDDSTFCKKNNLDINEWNKIVEEAKQVLYIAREERIRPGLDDKILTSWNALMLKGYTDAYRYLGDEHYLDIALQNANFITEKLLKKDNRLDRNYKNNTSSINAFLDDYALTIESFIGLYEVTFDEKWLYKAKDLSEYAIEHFYDEETKLFFYTSDIDAPLVARKMETSDNVIPSSNSTIAKSLYMLGIYFDQQDYKDKSILMLSAMKNHAIQYAPFYSNWAILMDMVVHPPYEIAIVGDNFEEKRKEMQQQFIPNALYMGGKDEGTIPLLEGKLQEGETFVYVCQNKVCKMPTTNVDEAISLIK